MRAMSPLGVGKLRAIIINKGLFISPGSCPRLSTPNCFFYVSLKFPACQTRFSPGFFNTSLVCMQIFCQSSSSPCLLALAAIQWVMLKLFHSQGWLASSTLLLLLYSRSLLVHLGCEVCVQQMNKVPQKQLHLFCLIQTSCSGHTSRPIHNANHDMEHTETGTNLGTHELHVHMLCQSKWSLGNE